MRSSSHWNLPGAPALRCAAQCHHDCHWRRSLHLAACCGFGLLLRQLAPATLRRRLDGLPLPTGRTIGCAARSQRLPRPAADSALRPYRPAARPMRTQAGARYRSAAASRGDRDQLRIRVATFRLAARPMRTQAGACYALHFISADARRRPIQRGRDDSVAAASGEEICRSASSFAARVRFRFRAGNTLGLDLQPEGPCGRSKRPRLSSCPSSCAVRCAAVRTGSVAVKRSCRGRLRGFLR